ncbi:Uncharacterised protein [Mycobacteroides abscessus subsp. abscessus]|nr:Uncharacterised protein [Mycobacteroides abscessus subsp. abscessus]
MAGATPSGPPSSIVSGSPGIGTISSPLRSKA